MRAGDDNDGESTACERECECDPAAGGGAFHDELLAQTRSHHALPRLVAASVREDGTEENEREDEQ